jgi:hypothetical protein
MPDNEYARSLANMMMGMTGMLPRGETSTAPPLVEQQPQPSVSAPTGQTLPAAEIPAEVLEDVRKAIEGGDVKHLMKLLQQEHSKRTPGSDAGAPEELIATPPPGQPAIDKDQVDALLQIAKDNSVTVDWLILRATRYMCRSIRRPGSYSFHIAVAKETQNLPRILFGSLTIETFRASTGARDVAFLCG